MQRTLGMIKDKKPLEIIWNNYIPKVKSVPKRLKAWGLALMMDEP
jgi:hypothetical protein